MVIYKKFLNELKIRGVKKLIKINNNNIDLQNQKRFKEKEKKKG